MNDAKVEFAKQSNSVNAPGVKRTYLATSGDRILVMELEKSSYTWTIKELSGYKGEVKGKTRGKAIANYIQDIHKAKDVAGRIFAGTFDPEADSRFVREDSTNIGLTNVGIAKRIKDATPMRVDQFARLLREHNLATDNHMLLQVSDKDRDVILKKIGKADPEVRSLKSAVDDLLADAEKALGSRRLLMRPIAYRGGDITEREVVLLNTEKDLVAVNKELHDTVLKKHPNVAPYGQSDRGAVAYGVNGDLLAIVMPIRRKKPDDHMKALARMVADSTYLL